METASAMPSPTAATTTVHFPRRQWVTLDSKWTCILTVTAELVWDPRHASPDAIDGPGVFRSGKVAAARVVELVRAGRLWIGSGGRSVDLAVQPTLVGKPIAAGETGGHFRERLCGILLGWRIWEDELGLRVRNGHVEPSAGDDMLHLTVNHPPSPHGLYTPRADGGIPQARLLRVSCQLDLNFCDERFKLSTPVRPAQQQKSKQKTQKTKKQKKPKKRKPPPPKPPRYKSGRSACRRIHEQKEQQAIQLRDVLLTDREAWQKATILVETALHMLVGTNKAGSRPRVPGVKPFDRLSLPGGAPGLLDVAPAVWSNDYFTAVSSRATYIPLIHRILASFTNAQSPSLRRKAVALTRGSQSESSQAGTREGLLGTKLEEVLLKGVLQLPRRAKKPVSKPPRSRAAPIQELHRALPTPEHSSMPRPPDPDFIDDLEGDDRFTDLHFDNLEAMFPSTPDDGDLHDEPVEELRGDMYGDGEIEAKELEWGDIEAWSEPNEYLDDEEDLFQEIDESWSPEDSPEERTGDYDEGDGEDGEVDVEVDLYEDMSLDESGIALWEEMQASQLDLWQDDDDDDDQMCYGEYMDDDEGLQFVDMDAMDLDEAVGLWRDEDDIIADCC